MSGIDLTAIYRRAHNEITANPRATTWIAAVSNNDVLALVAAVEAAQEVISVWDEELIPDIALEDLRSCLAPFAPRGTEETA